MEQNDNNDTLVLVFFMSDIKVSDINSVALEKNTIVNVT